jgi:capsular polysaccharide transport system permease protein
MTTSVPADTRVATVKQLRRMRARRLVLRLGIGVVLPTLVAAVYYGMLVTPQYESVTSFTVQSAEGGPSPSALQLLVASVPGSSADGMLVEQYILSHDMMNHLIAHDRFVEHYSRGARDWFSRLDASASAEERYEFYLDHVDVEHDSASGVLTLRVRAFSARQANRVGQSILTASERMVNEMNERARRDRIALSQREVQRAERRLTTARQNLARIQAERGELNPAESAAALLEVRGRLEGELAIARAELQTLSGSLQPDAQPVQEQRRRVAALQRQIDEQTRRLSGPADADIGDTIASFEPVVIEKEFAERAYESAMTSLELARVDADRQHRYLVRIAGPSQPDEPAFPRFWYAILTVLVVSFALLGIGTLLLASVREHANV